MLDPQIRQLRRPITDDQLEPLDPRCEVVQWFEPLSDAELRRVARFMEQYPHVKIRRYGYDVLPNLRFLDHFPFALGFQVDVFKLESFDGLEALSPHLRYLGISQTKSRRHSLQVLRRFPNLRTLHLEAHTKDFDVISELECLEQLTLRSITLTDLSPLASLKKLWSLELKLGGTSNLGGLSDIGRLQYLELWMVKGLHDLGPVAEVPTLEYLFLQTLKHVSELPSMQALPLLRRVHLETMRGLRDLSPLLGATALDSLLIIDARHMQPGDFTVLRNHPSLKQVLVGLGSDRKNSEVRRVLAAADIEAVESFPQFAFGPRTAA